uniref:F-box domain-containing protein n=1 Tax=Steinernema glaseri TaxID=37863 RepID=A0A1I7XZC2_9BILA
MGLLLGFLQVLRQSGMVTVSLLYIIERRNIWAIFRLFLKDLFKVNGLLLCQQSYEWGIPSQEHCAEGNKVTGKYKSAGMCQAERRFGSVKCGSELVFQRTLLRSLKYGRSNVRQSPKSEEELTQWIQMSIAPYFELIRFEIIPHLNWRSHLLCRAWSSASFLSGKCRKHANVADQMITVRRSYGRDFQFTRVQVSSEAYTAGAVTRILNSGRSVQSSSIQCSSCSGRFSSIKHVLSQSFPS